MRWYPGARPHFLQKHQCLAFPHLLKVPWSAPCAGAGRFFLVRRRCGLSQPGKELSYVQDPRSSRIWWWARGFFPLCPVLLPQRIRDWHPKVVGEEMNQPPSLCLFIHLAALGLHCRHGLSPVVEGRHLWLWHTGSRAYGRSCCGTWPL